MIQGSVSGHFIAGSKGSIFVLLRRPAGTADGCVLVVPPFAEEMNKCRRMVTEVSLGLAALGIATLVPDLYGTGDAEGDFADADWSTWQDDLSRAAMWTADAGLPVKRLLAIRLGSLLAISALSSGAIGKVDDTVLWQPVLDGARFVGQFLRLRVAASLMDDRRESIADLRQRFSNEGSLEIAGYTLPSRLVGQIESAGAPDSLPAEFGRTTWLELVRGLDEPLPPPSIRLIERTRALGRKLDVKTFQGEPYWASTEIVRHHEIIGATVSSLRGDAGDGG